MGGYPSVLVGSVSVCHFKINEQTYSRPRLRESTYHLGPVEGDGLLQFANPMIKVGATHVIIDAKAILPSIFSIKRSIEKSASSSNEKLIEEVNKAIKKYSLVGITTDL